MIRIRISAKAYLKICTLVMGYDKEVGWFGLVDRVEDADNNIEFKITDILIFPQYTNSCQIDDTGEDELEFCNWLNTLNSEDFRRRRFWGHSHVDMEVDPSSVDKKMFERFAYTNAAAIHNRFSICAIFNKRMDMLWWIYDAETDKDHSNDEFEVLYEIEPGISCNDYLESTKEYVKDLNNVTHTNVCENQGVI